MGPEYVYGQSSAFLHSDRPKKCAALQRGSGGCASHCGGLQVSSWVHLNCTPDVLRTFLLYHSNLASSIFKKKIINEGHIIIFYQLIVAFFVVPVKGNGNAKVCKDILYQCFPIRVPSDESRGVV